MSLAGSISAGESALFVLLLQTLSSELPLEIGFGLDRPVLAFAVLLSLVTGLVFGLVPALQSLRLGHYAVLKDQARPAGPGRGGVLIQRGLVIGQIAVSVVLLVSAGLFLKGLDNALDIDPGFSLRDGLIVPVNLGYGRSEAFGAVARIAGEMGDAATLEALITGGLKELGA